MKHIILGRLFIPLLLLLGTNLNAQYEAGSDTLNIWVDGICGMCKTRIENVALSTVGVRFADWNAASRQLMVVRSPEPLDVQQLHQNIADVGHDTELLTATEEAYQNLHVCCKYRDETVIASHQTDDEDHLHGVIVEQNRRGKQLPIIGATVYWLGTEDGVVTDNDGIFEIDRPANSNQLVVSYVGYQSDTLLIDQQGDIVITLSNTLMLDEVEVTHRKNSTSVSFIEAASLKTLNEKELLKAACCNLAESFETTASIDVSFTDAVTGTRKIEMLGLASPYLQITRENMPYVRGINAITGFGNTPGPWMEAIQINTGAGSVVNGFESFTGQINVELWKPETGWPAYFNFYTNAMGRLESNLSLNHSFNDKLHTGLLAHAKYQQFELDRNNDGFLDNPLGQNFILLNRWRYVLDNGWRGQLGVKATYVDSESGQLSGEGPSRWQASRETRKIEAWSKTGYVFPERPYSSLGIQFAAAYHEEADAFGARSYEANQASLYFNFIYQGIIVDSRHQFKTGLSYQWDRVDEELERLLFLREESVPGAYFEYTYGKGEPFTAVAGLRSDYHNIYGFFMTPRLHLRYAFNDQLVWRMSGGRGQRTASIIAEQIGMLASSRVISIQDSKGNNILESGRQDKPYGLNAEVGWNVGTTINKEFPLGEQSGQLSLSYYYTAFDNQIVVDFDESPQEVNFYKLEGSSFSHSVQAQLDLELLPRLDVRLAYRFNDVKVDYRQGQLEKPFVSRHRAFFNMGYETSKQWQFDATLNWQGARRIPSTTSNPIDYQLAARSPDFFLLNAQITKSWEDKWSVYIGAENLLDFRQQNPIIAADDPFSTFFDASLIWGPVFGRNIYAGMRYRFAGDRNLEVGG
jgi:outer membrane receptor for ferrienterochelin and colicins